MRLAVSTSAWRIAVVASTSDLPVSHHNLQSLPYAATESASLVRRN